jgi:DNA modification methylase
MRQWGEEPGVIGMEDDVPAHIDALVEMMDAVRRVLRSDGTAWLNVAGSYSMRAQGERQAAGRGHRAAALPSRPSTTGVARAKSLLGIPQRLELALVDRGWLLRSEIVWRKPNAMPEVVVDRPRRSTERILLLTKSERYMCECRPGMTDVWDIPTSPSPVGHPAGFPLALPAACIAASARPGDVVLDPFCGGGTTGVAALEAGCRFVGVDTSESCLEGARERLMTLQRVVA